ncbi:MAG TPA: cyclic nucleotide-binding domain-containing protein [Gaiellales bacterium]|jgi:voltage-gated potassium channel
MARRISPAAAAIEAIREADDVSSGPGRGLMGASVPAGGMRSPAEAAAFGREWAVVLADVPLFASLSKRHLRRVAKMASKVRFPARTVIVSPRRRADAFYVILDGKAEVATATGDLIELGPGRFFGEMALLDSGPRSATVTTKTEMLAMSISQRRFRELLESEPKIAFPIMSELATRVRRLETEA